MVFEISLLASEHIYAQLARFFITLVIGVIITKTIFAPLLAKIMLRTGDVKAQSSISNVGVLIGLFVTFTVALQAANFGNLVTVLGTIAAAATVAVGFGMREQVASVVAGVFIHMDNPFIKGDYIKVGDTEGVIKEIKLRATTLNSPKQEKQIVPNNKLTTEVVKNYTKGKKTKAALETKIPLERLEKTSEKLENIAKQTDKVIETPEPEIKNKNVEDDKAIVALKYWVDKPSQVRETKSKIIDEYGKYFSKIKEEEEKKESEAEKDKNKDKET